MSYIPIVRVWRTQTRGHTGLSGMRTLRSLEQLPSFENCCQDITQLYVVQERKHAGVCVTRLSCSRCTEHFSR